MCAISYRCRCQGGIARNDPDQHEHFAEILRICENAGIVPNFTTSGLGMTEDIAALCNRYCGAVAVSWYRSQYTLDAIRMLVDNGVKTNVHYVLSRDSIAEAIRLLKENGFPQGINAVIFLLHKPIGLGTAEQVITIDHEEFEEFLECIDVGTFPFKIGFDSCSVPALIGRIVSKPKYKGAVSNGSP